MQDAWLDNVDDTHIDPKLAGKRIETADEEESFELSSKEIGTMKRRMADVLLPGETVSFQFSNSNSIACASYLLCSPALLVIVLSVQLLSPPGSQCVNFGCLG